MKMYGIWFSYNFTNFFVTLWKLISLLSKKLVSQKLRYRFFLKSGTNGKTAHHSPESLLFTSQVSIYQKSFLQKNSVGGIPALSKNRK